MDPETAIRELTRGRHLLTKLRSLLEFDKLSHERSVLAGDSCEGLMRAFQVSISLVKSTYGGGAPEVQSHRTMATDDDVDSPTSVLRISNYGVKRSASFEDPNPKDPTRRRRIPHSKTIVTPWPFADGYQWRKYGEKKIQNLKHPRCYYKCTYEGCAAKLQVQQKFDSTATATISILYEVTHNDKHSNHSIDIFQYNKLPTLTPPTGSTIISFDSGQPFSGRELISHQRQNISLTKDIASSSSSSSMLQQALFLTVPPDDITNTDCIVSPPLSPAGQFYGTDALAYI